MTLQHLHCPLPHADTALKSIFIIPNYSQKVSLIYYWSFFSSFEILPANEGLGLVLSFLHQPNPSNPVQALWQQATPGQHDSEEACIICSLHTWHSVCFSSSDLRSALSTCVEENENRLLPQHLWGVQFDIWPHSFCRVRCGMST